MLNCGEMEVASFLLNI